MYMYMYMYLFPWCGGWSGCGRWWNVNIVHPLTRNLKVERRRVCIIDKLPSLYFTIIPMKAGVRLVRETSVLL